MKIRSNNASRAIVWPDNALDADKEHEKRSGSVFVSLCSFPFPLSVLSHFLTNKKREGIRFRIGSGSGLVE